MLSDIGDQAETHAQPFILYRETGNEKIKKTDSSETVK